MEAVFLGYLDEAGEEGQLDTLGGGVGGEVDDEGRGARGHAGDEVLKLGEELLLVVDGAADYVGSGDDRAVDVDGVAGVGDEYGVAGVENRQTQMGDALLGADGDDGFGFGVEIDAVAGLVPIGNGTAEAGEAAGDGIAMGGGL